MEREVAGGQIKAGIGSTGTSACCTCYSAEEREVRQVVGAGCDGRVRVGLQGPVAVFAQKQSCA